MINKNYKMDSEEANVVNEEKILLVSPSPFGLDGDNIFIYNLISQMVTTASKCKLAVLLLDTDLSLQLKNQNYNELPNIDKFSDNYLFQNIKFYSSSNNNIWNEIFQLYQNLRFDKLIVNSDLSNFETYCYPKINVEKIAILNLPTNFTNKNANNLLNQLTYFNEIITTQNTTKEILLKWNYDAIHINPLINLDLFSNMYPSEDIKSSFEIEKDHFVCLVICKNTKSCLLKEIVTVFSEFSENNKAVLYLHTKMDGDINLFELTNKLNISDKVFYTDENSYESGLTPELLSKFYNMSDVYINADKTQESPISILLPQCCDIPVISSKSLTASEFIFNGIVIEDDFSSTLKDILTKLYDKTIEFGEFKAADYSDKLLISEYKSNLGIPS